MDFYDASPMLKTGRLNRLVQKSQSYSDTSTVNYTYENDSRLT